MLNYAYLTPTVYTSVKTYGVLLTIRYLCYPRQRRGSEEKIWETILDQFAGHPDIEFAYPTHRYFDHYIESHIKPEDEASVDAIIQKVKK